MSGENNVAARISKQGNAIKPTSNILLVGKSQKDGKRRNVTNPAQVNEVLLRDKTKMMEDAQLRAQMSLGSCNNIKKVSNWSSWNI